MIKKKKKKKKRERVSYLKYNDGRIGIKNNNDDGLSI